jgi:hypothetical protein
MKPISKTSPEPELMQIWSRSHTRTRRRRWCRLPQSIAELMVVVAISGVGMAVVTEGSRRLNKGVTPRAPFILPIQRGVLQVPLPQPRDPSVIQARQGIDDAMIKQAPEGIDDGMIFPRPRVFRTPAALPPSSPVTPSNPQPLQPRPLP